MTKVAIDNGTLYDYLTGDALRPASGPERDWSDNEVDSGHPEGVILVDARSEWPDYPEVARRCYVQ